MGSKIKKPSMKKFNPAKLEQEIRHYWKKNQVFKESLEKRKEKEPYIFLEGPPTANGMPHPGHVLTRTMKDIILRYQSMKGYYIERKAGWDTHGLPVEIEVEKKLGLHTKQDIEKYGIEKFNRECRKSVFEYEEAWVEMTNRVGFWIDMDNPYITLENDYIESVWWSLKEIWKKGWLYKGHKVTPFCPRCGTALSFHEVAQGYKEVEDPSIFIKFKIQDEDGYFLAWTTTPWTLISNVALAVHPDEWYIKIKYDKETLILAEERCTDLLKGKDYKILDRMKGHELEKKEYVPLYNYLTPPKKCWYIVCADFVSMDEGTGIVHIAPAFGEDDYEVGKANDLPVIQLVNPDGTFPPQVKPWSGKFVKDADPDIIEDLRSRGLLEGVLKYKHQYPYCWRCDSPLLYYAIESWFIKMSHLRDALVKNNNQINWYPEHLKQGRFGDFIKEVRDWSLSRKRYWGTPLPIWTCKKCQEQICVGSVEEIKKLSTNFSHNYDLHRPFVDTLQLTCPKCKGDMEREEDVIDAWYDSGSAPFAQWHYPFEKEKFQKNFPANFICEAIDQTRGWFYSLLAVSTLIFNTAPYRNVLSLGHILDKDGQKMSKRKKNYVQPDKIFNQEGADAMRWYFVSANAPWHPIRFYEEIIKETMNKFLLTLWNIYSFFATYAPLDNFDPKKDWVPMDSRGFLDKWLVSRLNHLIEDIEDKISRFELHKAARSLEEFVINDFSNWYIRCSRKRFWAEEATPDKYAGYSTFYHCLITLSQLVAPFVPFISDYIYQNMGETESVHLQDYPTSNKAHINISLEEKMKEARKIVELSRSLRAKACIKLRHPLSRGIIVSDIDLANLEDILKDELNVKEILFESSCDPYMVKVARANYSTLGPKFKKHASMIAEEINKLSYKDALKGKVTVNSQDFFYDPEDIIIETREQENLMSAQSEGTTLILDIDLSQDLKDEGFAREIVRRIQEMRKQMDLEMNESISVMVSIDPERIKKWILYIRDETRSGKIICSENVSGDAVKKWEIEGEIITIGLSQG